MLFQQRSLFLVLFPVMEGGRSTVLALQAQGHQTKLFLTSGRFASEDDQPAEE